jgi:hypothetical protein
MDRTALLIQAKERSLRRELAIKTERLGQESAQVKVLSERLRLHGVMREQTAAEVQRGQTEPPEGREGVFVLHGRVVGRHGLGWVGLTVSAADGSGQAQDFACSDDRGYFKMEIAAEEPKEHVFLQVSDKKGSMLYRGSEAIQVVSQSAVYREIFLEEDKGDDPCSPPPEPQPGTLLAPNVVGQPEDKAVEMLKAAGLRVGKRKTTSDPKGVGLVVQQNPQAGTEVPPGSAVDLLIGVAEKVSVPELEGQPEDKAVEMLKAAGLRVGKRKTTSDPKRVGLVVQQNPQAGTEVSLGSMVDLLIGAAEEILVPKVVGQPEDKAVEMLKAAQLRVGERKTISDPQRAGLVVKQKPQFRTEVSPGTAVDLYIGV